MISISWFGLLFVLSLFIIGYIMEYRKWNKGICKKTNKKWQLFDHDSQGGRGYKSDDNYCWISYPFIDRRKE